ncbi:hypothetical protein DNTS_031422, partial [Danionella cerebrum]
STGLDHQFGKYQKVRCENQLSEDSGFGQNIQPFLNPKKTYEYKYEGLVRVGRELPDLVESAVKIKCILKITGDSPKAFVLQISNVEFEDLNGVPGKRDFTRSEKLSKRLSAEFGQPIVFEYHKGNIVDIRTDPGVSNTAVNIVKGMLGFLQVTVKTTQSFYELVELGIHGVCQSSYTIEEDSTAKELQVTQVVDTNKCQQPAAVYRGMALALEDKLSKQRGESVASTVKYTYTLKSMPDGGLITKAYAQERQYFSPFNVKGGNFRMLAFRDIELLKVSDTAEKIMTGPLHSRGNLIYRTSKDLNPIPVILDFISRLAQANMYHVDSATSTEILELIQLLRMVTLEDLEQLWKEVSGNNEHRRWFLDLVVEVSDERILKFLDSRFKEKDLTANEAGQALVVAFNHVTAEPVSVALAQEFLTSPFSKSHPLLWNTVVLAYGSLLYRYCVYTDPCPITLVQPLLDMATTALEKKSEEDMILVLKALGNAAHPSSIKTLIRFLPGYSNGAEKLPTRVQGAAVHAFRLLAGRNPHTVQDIVLNLFVQRSLPAEVRMLACMVLLETKPSMALVSVVTETLLEETDMQVASFSYSLLRGFAKSRTPDNHHLSTACSIAIKILGHKLGHLSYRYSKSLHFDWFHDDFLFGTSADVYMLQNESVIPTKFMLKSKIHAIGRILQFLEIGVRADGLKELFTEKIPQLKKDLGITDLSTLLKILSDWQNPPKDKPLLTAYARVFGQEAFLMGVKGDFIQSLIQSLSPSAGKESKVWEMIQNVKRGFSWHWTKPHLVYEARFIQPTCLGLPVEISKYYSIINAVTCGTELKTKVAVRMPWAFGMKVNPKEQKYEMNWTPRKMVTNIFSVNSNVYSILRNIEDQSSSKLTPMMPEKLKTLMGLPLRMLPTSRDSSQTAESDLKFRHCTGAKFYGTSLCMEGEAEREHYHHEYPLYYFLGHTHFSFHLEPAKDTETIEKIKIEISGGEKHTTGAIEMMALSGRVFENTRIENTSCEDCNVSSPLPEYQDLFASPQPVVTVKAFGVRPQSKPIGYEGVAFYLPTGQKANLEMIVSEVGEETSWKMCANANVDNSRSSGKVHLRWGAECQAYDVSMRVSTASESETKPSINTRINWGSLPSVFTKIAQGMQEYVPGVSYILGFNQKYENNPERQASVSFVASSPDTFDIRVKLPE